MEVGGQRSIGPERADRFQGSEVDVRGCWRRSNEVKGGRRRSEEIGGGQMRSKEVGEGWRRSEEVGEGQRLEVRDYYTLREPIGEFRNHSLLCTCSCS